MTYPAFASDACSAGMLKGYKACITIKFTAIGKFCKVICISKHVGCYNKADNYSSGIALSNVTNQLLGVLGPGLAGGVAAWLGARQIFYVDAASFIIAAVFILSLPLLLVAKQKKGEVAQAKVWTDIVKGTRLLFTDKAVRFA